MRRLEQLIFFILLISIPIQTGKHFWPLFSFVQGIRVDYLSPTLYISDIFLVLLIIISSKRLFSGFLKLLIKPLFLGFLIVIILGGLYAGVWQVAFLGILTFVEMTFFAYYISQYTKKYSLTFVLFALILGGVFEVTLLAFQFYNQASLGGVFYYFGERTFSVVSPEIAVFHLFGITLLRPYGTFPHPNIASFYLLITFILVLFSEHARSRIQVFFKVFYLSILAVGIFITFSRVNALLLVVTFVCWSYLKVKTVDWNRYIVYTVSIVASIFVLVIMIPRLIDKLIEDILLRMQLAKISWSIFLNHPLLGVGLNNFYYQEILYQKNITPTLLQPVHNIFLLALSSVGILGISFILLFLARTIKNISGNIMLYLLFFSIIISGLFDHYLLTLHQGQLLLAFLIGLFYSRRKVSRE